MSTGMRLGIALVLSLTVGSAWAAGGSAAGSWKTVDDKTGKEKARIEITENGGELQGRIVELFNPSKPDPVCEKCEGERHNQPITGMTILWDLKPNGSEWSGGTILDPANGKTYKSKAKMLDANRIGVSGCIAFICREQVWQRE